MMSMIALRRYVINRLSERKTWVRSGERVSTHQADNEVFQIYVRFDFNGSVCCQTEWQLSRACVKKGTVGSTGRLPVQSTGRSRQKRAFSVPIELFRHLQLFAIDAPDRVGRTIR